MNKRTRKSSHLWGKIAEYLCIAWLCCKGYSILALRYRNHSGEIDIIAHIHGMLIFIEVKARADTSQALASITQEKQRRILAAAQGFIAQHKKFYHHDLRFDAMVVTSLLRIHHLKDAWRNS